MGSTIVDHMPDSRLKGIGILGASSPPGAIGIQQPSYLPRIVNRRDYSQCGEGSLVAGYLWRRGGNWHQEYLCPSGGYLACDLRWYCPYVQHRLRTRGGGLTV